MENLEKILTKKQYNIYKMYLEGYNCKKIAEKIGCSRQNVSQSILISNKKIEKYNDLISSETKEEASGRSKILINYLGEYKTLSDWCREIGIGYNTAYARYKKGLSAEEIFKPARNIESFDYRIKEEYDLSLISDEYRYILQQKNEGKSFKEISEEFGCTRVNIISKARIAISQLNADENEYLEKSKSYYNKHKNDKNYVEYKRKKSREFYKKHQEYERERTREKQKNGGKLNNYQRKILKYLKMIESCLESENIENAKDYLNILIEKIRNDIQK